MRHTLKTLSDDEKLAAVQEYLTTSASLPELKSKYGFKGDGNIYRWMRKFDLKTPSEGEIKLNNAMAKEKDKTFQERLLEAELNKLKQELEHEKLRTLALTTLIDVAERELKIDIRKKRGAKQ